VKFRLAPNSPWREPVLIVWAIYVALVPLYIFKSGLPQPGDVFILILLPVALNGWNGKLNRTALDALRPLLWFTGWVFLVDIGWAVITGNFRFVGMDAYLLFPIYYLYNTLIVVAAFVIYRRFGDAMAKVTLWVVIGTVAVQVVLTLVIRSSSVRGTGLFNNPNQLGFYALLAACFISLVHKRLKSPLWFSTAGLLGCGYLAIVSASRSSTAGVAILMFLMVFSSPRVIVLSSIAAVGLLMVGGPLSDQLEASQKRMEARSMVAQRHGFFEERGYDRITQYKQYLVFGAGEGGLSRFAETSRVKNMELHSSAGTVLFSYGLVGSVLFLWFLWRVIWGARIRLMLILVPPLIYTVAHQGLRFTMLWILLAVFVAIKDPPKPAPTSPVIGPT